MAEFPTLTPLEALKQIRKSANREDISKDGFRYYLDAPQMCDDPAGFFPVATKGNQDWFPSGNEGEGITEKTIWVMI